MMDESRETGLAVIVGVVLVAIIMVGVLCGCNVKEKVITEYVAVHDTIQMSKTDTVRDIKVVTHTDTVRQVEWHTVTLAQSGDTVREVHHYYDTQRTIIVDSTDRYRAKVDSLRAALEREKEKAKEVKKKSPIAWYTWMAIALVVGVLCVAVLKSKAEK